MKKSAKNSLNRKTLKSNFKKGKININLRRNL